MLEGEIGEPTIHKIEKDQVTIHIFSSPEAGELVNSVIVETKNSLIAVDTPLLRPCSREYRAYIDKLGKTFKGLYITHSHPDHWFGLEFFQDLPSFAFQEVIEEIKDSGDLQVQFHKQMEGDLVPEQVYLPQIPIKEEKIVLDGVEINLLKIKNGEIKVALAVEIPSIKTLIAQDLIYNDVYLFIGEKTDGAEMCFDSWTENCRNFRDKGYELVIPGHGVRGDSSLFDKVIDYLANSKEIYNSVSNGAELKGKIMEKYPDYKIPLMLDMSSYFVYGPQQ